MKKVSHGQVSLEVLPFETDSAQECVKAVRSPVGVRGGEDVFVYLDISQC